MKTVAEYSFRAAVEADTSLLARALDQNGVVEAETNQSLNEELIFGLSGGVGFLYFLFEYKGHAPMLTFTCRSWSLPAVIVDRALSHAGVAHEVFQSGSSARAELDLEAALAAGKCVHLTVDAASLPGSGSPDQWKGQMPQQVNVVGLEGDRIQVDTAGALIELTRAQLTTARSALRKAKNRSYKFEPGPVRVESRSAVLAAVQGTARLFVEPPFKGFANNFGLAGLKKAARLTRDRKDAKGWARVFDTPALAHRVLARAWECSSLELTPKGGGRHHYASFLRTAAERHELPHLREAADLAAQSGERFVQLAADALSAGGASLRQSAGIARRVAELRRDPGTEPEQTAARIVQWRTERDELAAECDLTEAQCLAAFDRVGEHFEAIEAIESKMQVVLGQRVPS